MTYIEFVLTFSIIFLVVATFVFIGIKFLDSLIK